MTWFFASGFAIFAFVMSSFLTWVAIGALSRRAILDRPNERSSHTIPTPTGGGLAPVGVLILIWCLVALAGKTPAAPFFIIVGLAALLTCEGWIDDMHSISPFKRLLWQGASVLLAIIFAPLPGPVFGGWLPPIADGLIAGLAWVWFINLFNFMDGIDGLAGGETVSTGIGIAVVAGILNLDGDLHVLGLTMAATVAGFVIFNWHPARIFMGDTGSIPLGFLLGWLLLNLAAHGQWAAAAILPLYFLFDATWTLVRRAYRGEKVWHAHREHLYQKAVRHGAGHDQVVRSVLIANLVFIGLAAAAASGWVWPSLAGAAIVLGILVHRLKSMGGGQDAAG